MTTPISATEIAEAREEVPAVCEVWQPVRYSRTDTQETIDQVQANNAARLGYGCPQ